MTKIDKTHRRTGAPRWVRGLVSRLVPAGRADDVVGDLEEVHRKRLDRHGRVVAYTLTSIEALDVVLTLGWQRVVRSGATDRRTTGPAPLSEQRRTTMISWLDVKLGGRMLRKYPGLTVIGGLGMAVAIAIGAGLFAFFYAFLYPTLGFEDEHRIIALENWNVVVNNESGRSLYDFTIWRENMTTVGEMAAFRDVRRNLIVPGGPVQPIPIAQMTASGFRIANVPPFRGRFLIDEDERAGADPVIVLGYEEWQTRFAGAEDAVGREVRLGNTPHTIVGVMPRGYGFPMNHRFWIPMPADVSATPPGEGPEVFIFGRLAPDATVEQAQAELTAIGRRTATAFPDTHESLRPQVLPYTYPLVDIQDVSTWEVAVMQMFVSLLLVVVAVNVAVLAYARTATRRGEIAVRTALGADRRRIVGQLFAEALVLSGTSAVVGILLAKIGLGLGNGILVQEFGSSPFWLEYGLSPATMLYAVGLTVLAAVIVGVVPALQATGKSLNASLGQLGGSSMRLGATWTVLIVAQVAIAVVALPAAVAAGWSEIRQATTAPTFPAEEYVVARLTLDREPPPGADPEVFRAEYDADYRAFHTALMEDLREVSAVSDIAFSQGLVGSESRRTVEVEGVAPPVETPSGHRIRSGRVDMSFFDTFDASILTGRPFNPGDTREDATAVIVDRAFVEHVLGGANALGQRVRYVEEGADPDTMPWYDVVGVVSNLHNNPIDPDLVDPTLYHALAPESSVGAILSVRVRGGELALVRERLQAIVTAIDPTLWLNVVSLEELGRQEELALQLVALMVGLVLLSVLLLSAAGIYALMSFTVTQRQREIGIRTALGATSRQLIGGIFARATKQIGLGVALGVSVAIVLDMTSKGTYMAGHGAVLLPVMAGLMIVVGLLAALGPARRGLRLEPTESLREDG